MPGNKYDAGIMAGEEPVIIHAAGYKLSGGPEGHGYYAALCDDRTVVIVPNRFNPDAGNACTACRAIAAGG
jgi:hypothetical protein